MAPTRRLFKCRCSLRACERQAAQPPTLLRNRDVVLPLRPLGVELSFREVNVVPLQRHHLAAPKSGFTAEPDGQVGIWIRTSRFHRPLVFLEIEEGS